MESHRKTAFSLEQFFCSEENVWKLCEYARSHRHKVFDSLFAVFVSNHQKVIPLWKQKKEVEGKPVLWDYHVILLCQEESQCWVFDLDTTLPFPCSFEQYAKEALGSETFLRSEFHRLFRVVSAEEFLLHFASDRSHMRKADGSWIAAPPEYPPISTEECKNNLNSWISMDASSGWGTVQDLHTLCSRFSKAPDTFSNMPNLVQL